MFNKDLTREGRGVWQSPQGGVLFFQAANWQVAAVHLVHPAALQVFFSAEQQLDGLPWLGGQLLLGRLSWGGCEGHHVWFSLLFLLYSSILRFFTTQVSAFTWEKETVDVTCQ